MLPLLSASSIRGTSVYNPKGEALGDVKDLMVDPASGQVAYAVLDFGGFLGIGNKLFAVPMEAFNVDTGRERFVLDVTKDRLETAPGFDPNHWPSSSDDTFLESVYTHYGKRDAWLRRRTASPALAN